jgi:hypothetical protein
MRFTLEKINKTWQAFARHALGGNHLMEEKMN